MDRASGAARCYAWTSFRRDTPAPPIRGDVALNPYCVVRLLEPAPQLVVEILPRQDVYKVPLPPRSIVCSLDDSWASQPAPEGESHPHPVLLRIEPGEANSGHANKPSLLRDYLDILERFEQAHACTRQSAEACGSQVIFSS